MSPENSSTKTCPTCGTRLSENATRCLVCGRVFTQAAAQKSPTKEKPTVQGPRLPQVTLSLPVIIGLVIVMLALGAGVVYAFLQGTGQVVEPTVTPTQSATPTVTMTFTASPTATLAPTSTPEPPQEYTIQVNDSCIGIALAYGVSVQSIADLNKLPPDCGLLSPGQKLLIPRPTPTVTPQPSATLSGSEATRQSCGEIDYKVQANDTLGSIAANYNVSVDTLKRYNNMTSDIVFEGFNIKIPLCERLPTAGPTPTPTNPPPYPAGSLLLPNDGEVFDAAAENITLQWAAIAAMRANESYAVTVEDVTAGGNPRVTDYVTDTKYIVPVTLRPTDSRLHIFRWWVIPVRQTGTAPDGKPIWEQAGTASLMRVFGWAGTSGPVTAPTATP